MKILFTALILLGALALHTSAASSNNGNSGHRFIGLWEGIDSDDGSSQQVMISGGTDGVFDLLWRESYWTVCEGRRAILKGLGELDPDNRNTLVFEMTITCFDPVEVPVTSTLTFRFIGQEMVLVSDAEAFTDLPFFRVSSPLRSGARGKSS